MLRIRPLLMIGLLALALAPLAARANILWDFRGPSPVEVASGGHIRVGTL